VLFNWINSGLHLEPRCISPNIEGLIFREFWQICFSHTGSVQMILLSLQHETDKQLLVLISVSAFLVDLRTLAGECWAKWTTKL